MATPLQVVKLDALGTVLKTQALSLRNTVVFALLILQLKGWVHRWAASRIMCYTGTPPQFLVGELSAFGLSEVEVVLFVDSFGFAFDSHNFFSIQVRKLCSVPRAG